MSVELLQTLSFGAYAVAAALTVIAAVLFFVLDVRRLIGDMTGANARRAIEDIRRQNESSGAKGYKPSQVNLARGKTTDKITPSGNLVKQQKPFQDFAGEERFLTEELLQAPEEMEELSIQWEAGETTILSEEEQEFFLEAEMGFMESREIIE